jgi:hypothetical protein
MPSIQEALRAALTADATLTAVVADRIFPGQIPDDEDPPPWLYYSVPESVPQDALDGDVIDVRSEMEFHALGRTYSEAKSIIDRVIAVLNALTGTVVRRAFWGGTSEDTTDDGYHHVCRFEVWWVILNVPAVTVAPAISGDPTEGETLTASTGTWTGDPTSYAYQWYADGVVIAGATASTLVLAAGQVGALITVGLVATNGAGHSAVAISDDVGPVDGAWAPDDLTDLVATLLVGLMRSTGALWQDDAMTLAATADGHPVRKAVCPYTGVVWAAPSDSARPLLYAHGSGKWSLSFDGVDDTLRATYAGATTSPYAAWVGVMRTAAPMFGVVFATRDGARELRFESSGTNMQATTDDGLGVLTDPSALPVDTYATFGFTLEAGSATIYRNGAVAAAAADSTSNRPATALSVGSRSGGSLYLPGRVSALVYTEGAVSGPDRANLDALVSSTY